jgi:hypothetical protein
MSKRSPRSIASVLVAGCAGVAAATVAVRRRWSRAPLVPDPAASHLADDNMETLATSEGMAEAPEPIDG